VLYEVFSGRRAFEAPTIAELRRLHEESHAEQLTSSVRDLDPTIERVIFRCLEKDPANRPASNRARPCRSCLTTRVSTPGIQVASNGR
jgi:serine/threonine-protein kinase